MVLIACSVSVKERRDPDSVFEPARSGFEASFSEMQQVIIESMTLRSSCSMVAGIPN
jgi:hypothetical protein